MKNAIYKYLGTTLILFMLSVGSIKSQELLSNYCDIATLSEKEYESCLSDSAWNYDVTIKVNYISFLKTEILPTLRKERNKINLPDSVNRLIVELKRTYDSIFLIKFQLYRKQMDQNQKFVQPKAYISSVLSFEIFNFYPDIYAVVLNDPIQIKIHGYLQLKEDYNKKCTFLYSLLDEKLKTDIEILIDNFYEKKSSKKQFQNIDILQGIIPQELKKEIDVLNFLIWID